MRNRSTVIITGGLAGGLLAVALVALFAGRFAIESVGLSEGGDGQLIVRSGALYLATVVAALLGGVVVSAVAYGASATTADEENRFELAHILPFGLVTAVAVGYSIVRGGLGITAEIASGEITTTIAALALTSLIAGVAAGVVTAWVVATLAAKEVVGLEGEAAPASTAAMMRAALQAMTGPMVAIVVAAAFAIGLSQLLLAAEGTAAIAIFGGAGAIVLFGAAAAAYLGGGSNGTAG